MTKSVMRKAGRPRRRRRGELLAEATGLRDDEVADEPAEDRSGKNGAGDADEHRVEEHRAGVRAEPRDRGERPGMRRHQAVRHRQAGGERNREPHQRRAGRPREGEHNRREQHQADVEEHRQPDDEGHDHHGPGQPALAEQRDQTRRDDGRAAGFGEQLAQDRAQANHDRDETQRRADTGLERECHARRRQPRAQTGRQ